MRLVVAAVGRLKDGGERDVIARYKKRIQAAGPAVALTDFDEIEMPESRAATSLVRKDDEARRLLKSCSDADLRIALDEHGKSLSSQAFASWLGERRDSGIRTAAFLIGGPDGHGSDLLTKADLRLQLGAMTLPHGLARVVLVEQIYRALTLLAGHPYHRP